MGGSAKGTLNQLRIGLLSDLVAKLTVILKQDPFILPFRLVNIASVWMSSHLGK